MVTGIEIAGLTLASFPIAVDGLVRMRGGVETIRYWRRYRVKLEDYSCDLEAARVYYLDTLEELLTNIVESDEEMAILLGEPGGPSWKSSAYERNLKRRLDRSYDSYLQVLHRMQNALGRMREKLGIDESGRVSDTFTFHSSSRHISIYHSLYRYQYALVLLLTKSFVVDLLYLVTHGWLCLVTGLI